MFQSLLRQLGSARPIPAPRAARFRPLLEGLENRAVPAQVYHVSSVAALVQDMQTANTLHQPAEIILDTPGTYTLPSALTISTAMTIIGGRGRTPGQYVIDQASGVQGRLFSVTGASNVSFDGVTLQGGSTSGNGGALDVETTGAHLTLANDVVQNNHAGGDGGGVYVADGSALTIASSIFRNNTADGSGGGVSFNASSQSATVKVSQTAFDGNQAGSSDTSDGGGIRVEATTSSSARPPQVDVTVTATAFVNNSAGHDGGGMWNSDITSVMADQIYASGNTAVEDSGALGLSVMTLNSASFSFTNSFVASNRTTGPGSTLTPDAGGVCFDFQSTGSTPATGRVTATIACNIFADNSVAGAGGGNFVRDDAAQTTFDARLLDNLYVGNSATLSNIASPENGTGGGLYLDAAAASNTVMLSGNSFVGNTAATNGGGAYVEIDSGTANVGGNLFLANHAADGAGLYLTGSPGGATGGTVNLSQDAFVTDTASNDGGGVYVDSTITAQLSRNFIIRNSAGTAGGGVYNNGGTVAISHSTIRDNTAPNGPDISGSYTDGGGNHTG